MAYGRRRLSLQIQPLLTNNAKDTSSSDNSNYRLPTIPWTEPSLEQLSKTDVKYKSDSFGLNYKDFDNSVADVSSKSSRVQMSVGQSSFDFKTGESFVWVWNNVATRDKMRRKSLATCLTPTTNEPRLVAILNSHLFFLVSLRIFLVSGRVRIDRPNFRRPKVYRESRVQKSHPVVY